MRSDLDDDLMAMQLVTAIHTKHLDPDNRYPLTATVADLTQMGHDELVGLIGTLGVMLHAAMDAISRQADVPFEEIVQNIVRIASDAEEG